METNQLYTDGKSLVVARHINDVLGVISSGQVDSGDDPWYPLADDQEIIVVNGDERAIKTAAAIVKKKMPGDVLGFKFIEGNGAGQA